MSALNRAREHLQSHQYHWLITGVAGFIGSNLLETLLKLNQKVIGLDNFSTGHHHNLDHVLQSVGTQVWEDNFELITGDIRHFSDCVQAVRGVDFVLHHAALGSVPRSIEEPILSNESNVTGFLNMLVASRDEKVKRFVYAASSSTYGDHEALPKIEDRIGKPLSPYAVTKYVNELYADVIARCYGFSSIGLRYFNVFGPRQDPNGAYAAVIPRWISALLKNQPIYVNGDGETTRDFCYVENVVQINLLAALTQSEEATNQIYNVALGERTSLNQLYEAIRSLLIPTQPELANHLPIYRPFREGDIRHSQADISKAQALLEFSPTHDIHQGLGAAMEWYKTNLTQS